MILLSCFATVSVSAVENNETADNSVIGELGDGYSLCYDYIPSPPWMKAFYVQYDNYVFLNHNYNGEQGHGFYVKKNGEKLMLSEAFAKGITNIEEVVSIINSKDTSLFSTKIIDTSKVEGDWKKLYPEFDFSDNVDSPIEPAEYELGAVLVSEKANTQHSQDFPTLETLLKDFNIESVELLMMVDSDSSKIYYVKFVEKTKEIVWKAIETLEKSPYINYAEPNYYGEYLPVDPDPEIPTHPIADADCLSKIQNKYGADITKCEVYGNIGNYKICFAGVAPDGDYIFTESYYWKGLGDYTFISNAQACPYDLGVYIVDTDEAYTLDDAYNNKIINDDGLKCIVEDVFNSSTCCWSAYKSDAPIAPAPTPTTTTNPVATTDPTTKPVENPTQSVDEPSKEELAEGYEFGAVLVSLNPGAPSVGTLLKDFEIESIRLITPGSSTQNVYHVKFVEKTKEIVWRAIEVLKDSPYVKVAEPNYYLDLAVLPSDADCLSMIQNKYGADITKCEVYGNIGNYKICFAGVALEGDYVFNALYYWKSLGDYTFISTAQACPYDLGVYIVNKDEAYTLDDAYNNKLINDDGLKYIVEDVFNGSTCCWSVYESHVPIAPAPTPTTTTEPVETTATTAPTTKPVETIATTASTTEPAETTATTTPATEPVETTGSTAPTTNPVETTATTPTTDKTDVKTQEVFKNYIESFYTNTNHFTEDYLYENFGEYKGYKICFGGYNVIQPWEAKSRVGNYAFDLKTQMIEDKSLLGLYLVKDNQVITLANAYDNSIINNNDLDEIINIIKSCEHYKDYFSIYDIINVKVGTIGDRDLYYEGVVNYPNSINQHKLICLSKSDYAYYYLDLYINGGFSFLPMSDASLKTLYLVDRDNNTQLLFDALEAKTVKPNDVYTCLTTSKYNDSGYWFVSIAEVPLPPPVTTEPVTVAPKTTITLAKSSGTLYLKDSLKIKANIKNSTKKTTYKSSDTKIATVDSKGNVKAKKAGKAVITVTNNGVIKKFTVNVKNPTLNKKTVTVKKKGIVKVKIKGKIKGLKNSYINTKKAKVISSKSASTLKIKGLKKGNTILKIKVSGVTLKLRVKVR